MPSARANMRIIKDIDTSKIDALKNQLGKKIIRVGVPTGDEDQGVPMALVAAANEFGTSDGRIPERPAFRTALRRNKEFFRDLNKVNLKRVYRGTMTADQALNQLGVAAVGAVKEEIRHGQFTPNAPSTIERKGSDHPLIDQGQLVQSVNYDIIDK